MEGKKSSGFDTRAIVMIGLLTALEIVLSRFVSISAWNMKIGFAFIPVVVAAMMYGPAAAAAVGALGDIIGATLFPIGPYFPGFTLTAGLMGVVFGLFLRKKQDLPRTAAAVLINQLPLSLGLNTLWISLLYGGSFTALLLPRLVQSAILIPVEIAVILLMSRFWGTYLRKRAGT